MERFFGRAVLIFTAMRADERDRRTEHRRARRTIRHPGASSTPK